MNVTLRPATSDDEPFLMELYSSTRRGEVGRWGWPVPAQEAFLKAQFLARRQDYERQFPDSVRSLIILGVPIGAVVVDRAPDEIRLVDIALAPESCGRGIGSQILRELMAAAAAESKPLRLQVHRENRALGLYRRIGMVETGADDVYVHMEHKS